MDKKIVVTGGAGFIGSAIVYELNKRGLSNIIIVDHLGESEKWKNLVGLKFEDYFEKDDFLKFIYERGLGFADTVFHMGACSSTLENNSSYLIKNNFEYSKFLLLQSLNSGTKFIYASSAATYGNGEEGFDDNEEKIERLKPLNPYAFSKHLFDLWVKRRKLFSKVTGLKYFNVFGPNEYHKGEMRSFVVKAFEQIKKNGKVKLFKSYKKEFKDGEQKRDFIYIKDAVKITLFLWEQNIKGLFNVGTGKAQTWNKLVKLVFKALGLKPEIEYIDMPEDLRKHYQYFTQAKIDKLKRAGYKEDFFKFDLAISEYVRNYLLDGKRLAE